MPRATRHSTAIELGMNGVDLTAIATTEYAPVQGFLDVRQYFSYTAIIDIFETTTTPATGDMTFRLDILGKDKSTILWTIDLLTLIDTSNNAQQEVVLFGAGAAAVATAGSSGTLSADAEVFKVAEYFIPVLEITTPADGDATANFQILMEG